MANGIRYGTNVMANWWEFTGDWDNAIRANHGLYRAPQISFVPASLSRSDGVLRATLTGDAGFNYTLEATTNLAAWNTLAAITNFPGIWQFSETNTVSRRLYRVSGEAGLVLLILFRSVFVLFD